MHGVVQRKQLRLLVPSQHVDGRVFVPHHPAIHIVDLLALEVGDHTGDISTAKKLSTGPSIIDGLSVATESLERLRGSVPIARCLVLPSPRAPRIHPQHRPVRRGCPHHPLQILTPPRLKLHIILQHYCQVIRSQLAAELLVQQHMRQPHGDRKVGVPKFPLVHGDAPLADTHLRDHLVVGATGNRGKVHRIEPVEGDVHLGC
mmetsp:Transcript_87482/g.199932  ORF Transcript_87482/g.199932 Transcript_87482/m.199932 type:complete len:203 (-) Transcript_87482:49-657(-)